MPDPVPSSQSNGKEPEFDKSAALAARSAIRHLREMELDSTLQAEVLEKLLDGKKTTEELVALIYKVPRESQAYQACYMRVRRAAKRLEEKGLTSRPLFGRDKPHKLTRLALERLLAINGHRGDVRIVPMMDRALYLVLLVVFVLTWASATIQVEHHLLFTLSVAVIFLGGLACCRFLETIRRVA